MQRILNRTENKSSQQHIYTATISKKIFVRWCIICFRLTALHHKYIEKLGDWSISKENKKEKKTFFFCFFLQSYCVVPIYVVQYIFMVLWYVDFNLFDNKWANHTILSIKIFCSNTYMIFFLLLCFLYAFYWTSTCWMLLQFFWFQCRRFHPKHSVFMWTETNKPGI